MRVADLDEAELLAYFLPLLTEHNERAQQLDPRPRLVLGPGDDCSVLDLSNVQTVISTDTLTEGHDFRLRWKNGDRSSGFEVGWKAATQNLADIAAMGASACTLLVSLSVPPHLSVHWIKDFAGGLLASCRSQGAETCTVSGGDLGRAEQISITVTALGITGSKPVLRSGAQPGDFIAYAGVLGHAAGGLQLLETAGQTPENFLSLVRAQKQPRGALGAARKASLTAHAMIDISDGLLRDAARIAAASGLDIELDMHFLEHYSQQLLPAARYVLEYNRPSSYKNATDLALDWVLTGGEDHAMLAVFAPGEVPENFSVIGSCVPGDTATVKLSGRKPNFLGWDHFNAR